MILRSRRLELGDDFEKLQYIGSTIPAIVEELPFRLAEIEQLLAEKELYIQKKIEELRN